MNLPAFSIAFLRGNWKLLLGAGIVLLLIVQTFRLQNTQAALEAERAGRTADRSEYRRAQAEATANAIADARKKEAEDAKKADAADARYADLSQQYRAAVLRYGAAQSAARQTDLPVPSASPASSDRPGGPTIVPQGSILIPQEDALICANNTARLEAVREWTLTLDPN
ncbi:hypothetical protein [Sphingobium chungbukense]|uniref:Uncharacterized protein n=1 Tax=Sphingobium chungbukense TaxID=56193 RepID=A0A0M3AR84_9SPHN|nr:hypothetical protein [Sphingobium chungbukense]KKW92702.1 hypothetical protein YP76_07150 [Sphingobium chungbukense]